MPGVRHGAPALGKAAGATASAAPVNAKHAAGRSRPALHFIPPMALYWVGYVFEVGATKYDWLNWAETGVVLSVYTDAIDRHKSQILAGEDIDPETGAPHWAAICACAMIALDAHCRGNLIDDRPPGHQAPLTALFAEIMALKADKLPPLAAARKAAGKG